MQRSCCNEVAEVVGDDNLVKEVSDLGMKFDSFFLSFTIVFLELEFSYFLIYFFMFVCFVIALFNSFIDL